MKGEDFDPDMDAPSQIGINDVRSKAAVGKAESELLRMAPFISWDEFDPRTAKELKVFVLPHR